MGVVVGDHIQEGDTTAVIVHSAAVGFLLLMTAFDWSHQPYVGDVATVQRRDIES